MQEPVSLISVLEKNAFFQFELLVLLASLVLSLALNQSLPYFAVSAIAFLTSLGSLSFELVHSSTNSSTYIELTTTSAFTLLLLATFFFALIRRQSLEALKWHAATTLACSVFLAMKAFWILRETARFGGRDVSYTYANDGTRECGSHGGTQIDRCALIATGFASMHLLASLLMMHDCSRSEAAEVAREQLYDEKRASIV